jgi:capsule polysaccharide export protein KpsE/RkpR
MIAAQSQLEGLRQIYTDNNPRVRSLNARVAVLRKQLEKIGGKQGNGTDPLPGQTANRPSGQTADMPYPTIRSLPLLGVKYGDFYRRAKIQETVYELLTQQYELAKVQEAKETPSVKILDPASIPEKKSFPPRLMIISLGTLFAVSVSVVWVLASNRWLEADPQDPRKILAHEVAATLTARMPWASPNGSRFQAMTNRVWVKLARRSASTDEGK